MPRFIVAYRWELWLLLGAPAVAVILSAFLVTAVSIADHPNDAWGFSVIAALLIADGIAMLVLLLPFYGRVRRAERRFLSLVWGYVIALEAIQAIAGLVALALALDVLGTADLVFWLHWALLASGILSLPALLWFALQASRFSLAHAFFLFLVTQGERLADIAGSRTDTSGAVSLFTVMMILTVSLAAGPLFAWLLGNFEGRGALFRNRAVVVLLMVCVLSAIVWMAQSATGVSGFGLYLLFEGLGIVFPLALIYLVCARQLPAPPSDEPPQSGVRVQ